MGETERERERERDRRKAWRRGSGWMDMGRETMKSENEMEHNMKKQNEKSR
jgi:hypothetical protein